MLPTISDMTSTTISSIDVKEACLRGNLEEVGNRREGVNERFMLIGLILSASGVFFVNVNGREWAGYFHDACWYDRRGRSSIRTERIAGMPLIDE